MLRYLPILACLAVCQPDAARAMPTPQQQFLEATRATPDLERGAQYFTACAACHGDRGGGSRSGEFPRIGGQHFAVLVRQLIAFRNGLRWDYRMEGFASRHRLADMQAVADVAAYVSLLADSSAVGTGTGAWLERGARIYFRSCESCHGSSGQGDAKHVVPRLAGQHYEYLRRQIYDAVDGRRPGFPAFHVRLLARLDHDGIAGVADYLSRLGSRHEGPGPVERISPP